MKVAELIHYFETLDRSQMNETGESIMNFEVRIGSSLLAHDYQIFGILHRVDGPSIVSLSFEPGEE